MVGFTMGDNLGALKAYNALNKANTQSQEAGLRLATRKRINSVADDVSGFNVGKSLDQKVRLMDAAQKNIGAAKNMLSTGESALLQVKEKITDIRKYIADASDPTKDRKALAENIKSLGQEIENIFKTTKFNNTELLMGTIAAASIGTNTALSSIANSFTFQTGADITDRINLDFASGLASAGTTASVSGSSYIGSLQADVANAIGSFQFKDIGGTAQTISDYGVAIASLADGGSTSIISKLETAVDDALGKIGNFVQRLDVKEEYLNSAISNATASVIRLFDANMALEQLNSTKAQLGGNLATTILGQLNMQPQNLLSLFR